MADIPLTTATTSTESSTGSSQTVATPQTVAAPVSDPFTAIPRVPRTHTSSAIIQMLKNLPLLLSLLTKKTLTDSYHKCRIGHEDTRGYVNGLGMALHFLLDMNWKEDIETAAANVLDIAAPIDPFKNLSVVQSGHLTPGQRQTRVMTTLSRTKIIPEIKYHLICEKISFDLILCRDIAEQETVKHILSGGWWQSQVDDGLVPDWMVQGCCVYGCATKIKKIQPRVALRGSDMAGVDTLNAADLIDFNANTCWYCGKYVVARSQDMCNIGDWVFARSPLSSLSDPPVTGRILDILQDTSGKSSLVILDLLQVAADRHEVFGMPILKCRLAGRRVLIISATGILFEYNVQHDCRQAGFQASCDSFESSKKEESCGSAITAAESAVGGVVPENARRLLSVLVPALPHPRAMDQGDRLSDTPTRPKANQSSNYYFGNLPIARAALMDNLGSTIPMITFEQMLSHVLPQLDLDFQATWNKLVQKGHLEQVQGTYKWSVFPTVPKDVNSTEPIVFLEIKAVQDAIVANAVFASGRTTQTAEYFTDPARALESVRIGNDGKPDGCGRLQYTAQEYVKPGWMCITWAEEYKKKDAAADEYDNAVKVIWSLHHLLRDDPRRRCAFGITIENTATRVWFASRSIVFNSEPFDFLHDCEKYIKLIIALSYGSAIDLGFDPTIKARKVVEDSVEKIFFDFTVKGTDSSEKPITKIYRTVRSISEFGADAICGRGMRVYEVKEVDNGILKGDTLALKDCWVDDDRELEGDILANILLDCKDEEHDLFLTLVVHGLVEVDGNLKYQFSDKREQDIASPDKVSSGLPRSSVFVPITRLLREENEHHWKHHYRLVFKEVGISMYDIRSIRGAFQALVDVTKALEVMAKKDYVHRDISGGNILFYKGHGKLCDLEYAVTPNARDFMPIEVFFQEYIILPTHQPTTSFREWAKVPRANIKEKLATLTKNAAGTHNPRQKGIIHTIFHDTESLWWVAVWILFWSATTNICLLEDVTRRIDAAMAIFPSFGATTEKFQTRSRVLQGETDFEEYTQQLPGEFTLYGAALDACRSSLSEAYVTSRRPDKDSEADGRFELLQAFRNILSGTYDLDDDVAILPLLEVYSSLKRRKPDTPADDLFCLYLHMSTTRRGC
ncbi:uncharacterized protein LACBIDRAFT_332286 [Laccaria bicolor S238N-H82]|uniref:Predicted protein n=1 Tax=Laccaria bicolor (strain S238N-H82 / ATCC MYA-4686) TaxID=486041 RepID=B0DS79_LACBS|nr:uncharacterized protein LACBIDRAFT_332286 [Laccaria bicolor S238N-H82]EDR02424.1 predicted protein [Laccaria bicolor S238N-H82]|eukprot:XP_001886787.1 predicted protein [Laccaria bicolor S238N-H82]